MGLYKEYEKQRKYNKRFIGFMVFLLCFLPLVIWVTRKTEFFFVMYLVFLEALILLAIIINKDNNSLEFDVLEKKIIIRTGLLKKRHVIYCDMIVVVHTVGEGEELQIILISVQKSRNKFFKAITKNFLKKYPEASREYLRIKRLNPELHHLYFVIKKGGFYKYELLEALYKKCTYSKFTDSSIESIKKIKY